ncbi:MAG: hypothetical protein OHK93_000772 [Ramalina farinacea]|uniref:Importin N-terminal domain-containing protein n=1 Tax=Ramalina farinacea TaxID=258253 RepID=A0AA43QSH8_9LECA|nr:hypothetical protein [Ramalina farinacea]
MDKQKFLQVFSEVLAPDTDRVKSATATLKADYYPLPESLTVLLQLLLSDEPSPQRQLAASQARSLVPKHWRSYSSQVRAQLRQRLLQGTLQEDEQIVRHAASRVITAIAKIDLEDNEWPDVFDQLLGAAKSNEPRQREVGTYLLFTGLETISEAMQHRNKELLATFKRTIHDSQSAEVRINTMLAISRLAIALDSEEDPASLKLVQDLVPDMVAVLEQAIGAGDEDRTTQCFEVFQTLLGCDSSVLNKHFADLTQFMVKVASEKSLGEDMRTQAISFLMQCMRYRKMKMQSLKVGQQITLMCLEIATELGDAMSEDDEDVTTARSALGLLDEMASSLPPNQVVVPLLDALGPYVNSPDPDRRQGGIMALGMVVEGAPDFIATQLHEIFPLIFRLLEDSEMKVRRAALDGVMRVSEELAEEVGKEHKKLIPILVKHLDSAMRGLKGLDDKVHLDIIKASCNSIESVVDGLEASEVKPYLSEFMTRFTKLFSIPDLKTRGAAVSAAGSLGSVAEEGFLPYFEPTMHALQDFVELKDSSDELDLRSQTIDAMGSMAMAVGPKAFQKYVRPLMQATDEGLHLDHPKLKETSYLFWAMMAKVYKDDFKPFIEGVVKALFESLETEEADLEVDLGEENADLAGKEITIGGKKIKVAALAADTIVDSDDIEDLDVDELADASDDDDEWDDDLEVISAVAQEKEIAAEVLGEILTHATKDYLPYMEKTIEAVLPLVEHEYEGLQKAALSTLFRAYAAVWELQPDEISKWKPGLPLQQQPGAQVKKLGELIMTATLAMWENETDRALITDINRNIAATLKASGPSLIADPTTLKPVTETLVQILTKDHPCQKDFGDESDAAELLSLDETSEYDWLTIDTAMDAICGLAAALGPSFSELWKIFAKPVLKYASGSSAFERATAVGVVSEVIRSMGGEGITPHTSTLLPLLMKRLTDEDPETKSNAAYAVGLLQQHSQDDATILKQFPSILTKLEPLLQTANKARMKDNAAGCVCRMIMRHPAKVPVPQVVTALIEEVLPLREDFDENEPVWDCLVGLYQQEEPTLISLTPQLLPILAEVLAPEPKDQLKEETRGKLVQLVGFLAGKDRKEVGKYEVLREVLS